jgi:hypothetical protein
VHVPCVSDSLARFPKVIEIAVSPVEVKNEDCCCSIFDGHSYRAAWHGERGRRRSDLRALRHIAETAGLVLVEADADDPNGHRGDHKIIAQPILILSVAASAA